MSEPLRTVLALNPSPMTLDGTRTFIVGHRRPAVIDPGPDIPEHVDAIERALNGAAPAVILLTHGHGDHADAVPELARRTGAPVAMARAAPHLPFAPSLVSRWLEDGEEIDTDAGPLISLPTPGHAPEHVSFLWRGAPGGPAMFVGDTFMGQGDTTLVSPPEGDLGAYLRSLDRVAAAAPAVLHPAHGPAIRDAMAAVERYRKHRAERVEQVVRALRRAGPSRPGALLDAVYGAALHPALRLAAEGSLAAILAYLAGEGRVTVAPGGAYTLVS